MDWLRLIAVILLVLFIFPSVSISMVLMVRLWSSRARESWTPRYMTIDRLRTRASVLAPGCRAESQSETSQSQGGVNVVEVSSVRADLVLPNNFVVPVSFVTRERDGRMEIHSKVPMLLVISWVWPVLFVPALPFCFIYLAGPQWIAVVAVVMMMITVPLSCWLSFRGIRAMIRDLRKTTLGV